MTFTNLEKYVYSKKCLKQRRQPPTTPPSSKVEGQERAKVFSRQKRHLATAVIKGLNGLFFKGEVQIFSLIAIIISFLSRNSSAR